MGDKGEDWFKKCYDQLLDHVGSMSDSDIQAFERKMVDWVFCDGMEPLIRSGYLNRVSAYELSKALAEVLEKQKEKGYEQSK